MNRLPLKTSKVVNTIFSPGLLNSNIQLWENHDRLCGLNLGLGGEPKRSNTDVLGQNCARNTYIFYSYAFQPEENDFKRNFNRKQKNLSPNSPKKESSTRRNLGHVIRLPFRSRFLKLSTLSQHFYARKLQKSARLCINPSSSSVLTDASPLYQKLPDLPSTSFYKDPSSGLTPDPPRDVSHDVKYPQGKPTWEQLQHIALRLSDSVPKFFNIQLDYTFFHENVELINRLLNTNVRGVRNLVYHFGTASIVARFRWLHCHMNVLSVTPVLEDATVRLRFRVEHLNWFEALYSYAKYGKDSVKHARWLDGYGIFFVNGDGLVYKVVIDKVMPDDEKGKAKPKTMAERVMQALKRRVPAPSLAPSSSYP